MPSTETALKSKGITIDETKNSIHSYPIESSASSANPESVEMDSSTESSRSDIHWKIKHGEKPYPSYHERTFCEKCTLNWNPKKGCPGATFNMSSFHRCDREFYIPPSKYQPGPLDYKAENAFLKTKENIFHPTIMAKASRLKRRKLYQGTGFIPDEEITSITPGPAAYELKFPADPRIACITLPKTTRPRRNKQRKIVPKKEPCILPGPGHYRPASPPKLTRDVSIKGRGGLSDHIYQGPGYVINFSGVEPQTSLSNPESTLDTVHSFSFSTCIRGLQSNDWSFKKNKSRLGPPPEYAKFEEEATLAAKSKGKHSIIGDSIKNFHGSSTKGSHNNPIPDGGEGNQNASHIDEKASILSALTNDEEYSHAILHKQQRNKTQDDVNDKNSKKPPPTKRDLERREIDQVIAKLRKARFHRRPKEFSREPILDGSEMATYYHHETNPLYSIPRDIRPNESYVTWHKPENRPRDSPPGGAHYWVEPAYKMLSTLPNSPKVAIPKGAFSPPRGEDQALLNTKKENVPGPQYATRLDLRISDEIHSTSRDESGAGESYGHRTEGSEKWSKSKHSGNPTNDSGSVPSVQQSQSPRPGTLYYYDKGYSTYGHGLGSNSAGSDLNKKLQQKPSSQISHQGASSFGDFEEEEYEEIEDGPLISTCKFYAGENVTKQDPTYFVQSTFSRNQHAKKGTEHKLLSPRSCSTTALFSSNSMVSNETHRQQKAVSSTSSVSSGTLMTKGSHHSKMNLMTLEEQAASLSLSARYGDLPGSPCSSASPPLGTAVSIGSEDRDTGRKKLYISPEFLKEQKGKDADGNICVASKVKPLDHIEVHLTGNDFERNTYIPNYKKKNDYLVDFNRDGPGIIDQARDQKIEKSLSKYTVAPKTTIGNTYRKLPFLGIIEDQEHLEAEIAAHPSVCKKNH